MLLTCFSRSASDRSGIMCDWRHPQFLTDQQQGRHIFAPILRHQMVTNRHQALSLTFFKPPVFLCKTNPADYNSWWTLNGCVSFPISRVRHNAARLRKINSAMLHWEFSFTERCQAVLFSSENQFIFFKRKYDNEEKITSSIWIPFVAKVLPSYIALESVFETFSTF